MTYLPKNLKKSLFCGACSPPPTSYVSVSTTPLILVESLIVRLSNIYEHNPNSRPRQKHLTLSLLVIAIVTNDSI